MKDRREEECVFLIRIYRVEKIKASVADPLRRVVFGRELGDLRYVVHIASLTVVVEYVFGERRAAEERRVVVICKGLLSVPFFEAYIPEQIPRVVHFAYTAGIKAVFRKFRIEAFSVICRDVFHISAVSRAVRVLPGVKREPCGNADGRRGVTSFKYHRICGERVKRRCVYIRISECTDSVVAQLVEKDKKYVFQSSPLNEIYLQ